MQTSNRPFAAAALILTAIAADFAVNVEPAEARRGFASAFRGGGRAVAGAPGAASGAVRSAAEAARLKEVASSVDWREVARTGLGSAKSAIEGASRSATGSAPAAFSGSTLDIVELEACMREARWLDLRSLEFDVKKASLDSARERIEKLGDEIDAARAGVNRSSQRAVDAFNARLAEHRRLVARYNDVLLPEVRAAQQQFNGRVATYNGYCDGKSYYTADHAEVEQRLLFAPLD